MWREVIFQINAKYILMQDNMLYNQKQGRILQILVVDMLYCGVATK